MQNRNEILFPVGGNGKHPNTKNVIKMAEESGILIKDIATLMQCTQPYVSQLKAGKGKAKKSDLEPVIHKLSPELPGESFHTYTVFNKAIPVIPDDWEEQVLMSGLLAVTEQSERGRYPVGEDGFNVVVENHNTALEKLDDNCKIYEKFGRNPDLSIHIKTLKNTAAKLNEGLASYIEEDKTNCKNKKESLEELQAFIASTIDLVPRYIRDNSDIDALLEEVVIDKLKCKFERSSYSTGEGNWFQQNLVDTCRLAAIDLNFAPAIKEAFKNIYGEIDRLEEEEYKLVLAPKEHAERLLAHINNILVKHDEKNEAKKYKFRLDQLCNSKASKQFSAEVILEPSKPIAWLTLGESLFGNMLRKVFETETLSHDVNLTTSFAEWAKKLGYKTEEEEIQICGEVVLSTQIGANKLVIHELYTKQFVVLNTFTSTALNREVTTLSDKLSVIELLEYVETNSSHFDWTKEGSEALGLEIKSKLSAKGFRVPGVRSIY